MAYNTMRNSSGFQGDIESGFSAELNGDIPGNVVLGVQGPKGDPGPQGIPGVPGIPFTYEDFTPEQLEALRGPQGEPGDDYVLTPADKAEIAEMAAELVEVPTPDSGENVVFVVQDAAPEDTSVLWVDPTDNSDDGFQEAVNTALAQAKESGEFDGKDGVVQVTGATVGQTVKIAEVDENGVPTAWEAVEFPSGGGGGEEWELIREIEITEEGVTTLEVSDFTLKKLVFASPPGRVENIVTQDTNETNIYLNGKKFGKFSSLFRKKGGTTSVFAEAIPQCTSVWVSKADNYEVISLWQLIGIDRYGKTTQIESIKFEIITTDVAFGVGAKFSLYGVRA